MKFETVMEIDLKKLKYNTGLLCKSYGDYEYKIVDLKDNAHGLGLKIINEMNKYGINYCLVGSLKDALEIRKINKDIDILVNYYVTKEEIYDCINNNVTITIQSDEYLDEILSVEHKDNLNVQILIDNGSNLLGIKTSNELDKMIDKINNVKNITLTGIYTDITTLGVIDENYYKEVNNFYKIAKKYLNKDLMIHFNEPIMYHTKLKYVNGIRFDLSILGIEENIADDFFTNRKIKAVEKKYGCLEFPEVDLQLVFNITSEVMNISKVPKGTMIGRNYMAKEDVLVATLPIGHKDGITKAIKFVGINGFKREILTDDIDKIIVAIDESIKVKDKVYIINEERDVYSILKELHTNRYYLMSILNRNLTRVYINQEENIASIL